MLCLGIEQGLERLFGVSTTFLSDSTEISGTITTVKDLRKI
jgi:hypothetical protein